MAVQGVVAGGSSRLQARVQYAGLSRILRSFGVILVVLLFTEVTSVQSQLLSTYFYQFTCPNLTNIVREAMDQAQTEDPMNLPGVLRLFAHDFFVNGVDGSVLLDSVPGQPQAEKDAQINLSLFGFDAIENAKIMVEEQCPGVVSCADILTLAAQLAVEMTGGPIYNSLLGRRDSTVSLSSSATADVPTAIMTMSELVQNFAAKTLTQRDLVVLSGAHTIGFAHCAAFSYRIYNYTTTNPLDPTMDPNFAAALKDVCSQNPDPGTVEALDNITNVLFDEQYFANLQQGQGLLESDQLLDNDPNTRGLVNIFANDQTSFFIEFVRAMHKMGRWNVLTGLSGQIRQTCNVVNSNPLGR